MNSLQVMLTLCLAAYCLHIIEEFMLDWRDWAQSVLGLPARWEDFYVTNALVVVIGAIAVVIAPALPAVGLGFAALMIINATFFHVAPFLWTHGRFSPGLITAVFLFYPASIAAFVSHPCQTDDLLTAFAVGALLMATPVVLLRIGRHQYFDQTK